MNRATGVLLFIVAVFVLFIGVQAGKQYRRGLPRATVATEPDTGVDLQTQDGNLVRVRRSTLPPPAIKDYAAIAQVIADGRGVTYVDEILTLRGGNIARWIDRRDNPITVWIQRSPGVKDFWPDYPNLARNAFYTWSNAGIPIRFLFIADSAAAEVRVRWVEHFNDAAAGKTYWARDVNWWILGADVELALHSQAGQAYDREAVHAIALHEVGHLIGLDHATSQENIMAPRVHTLKLSSADLRTANLIYKLPPGPTRAP